jgi:hypothetical protein
MFLRIFHFYAFFLNALAGLGNRNGDLDFRFFLAFAGDNKRLLLVNQLRFNNDGSGSATVTDAAACRRAIVGALLPKLAARVDSANFARPYRLLPNTDAARVAFLCGLFASSLAHGSDFAAPVVVRRAGHEDRTLWSSTAAACFDRWLTGVNELNPNTVTLQAFLQALPRVATGKKVVCVTCC